MRNIAESAKSNPSELHLAPITTPVSRMDEVKAAKEMVVIHPESR